MDLTLKYSKTSKGSKAVLAKPRNLSSHALLVLTNIDGHTPASSIQEKLQLKESKFAQAFHYLLEESYIQVVQDFGPSIFDLKSAIEVSEISSDDFFKLELPEESFPPTQQRIEAQERAKNYEEAQSRKVAQAREQEEAERQLLSVTDILAKSGHKIDIEELAETRSKPSTAASDLSPRYEDTSVDVGSFPNAASINDTHLVASNSLTYIPFDSTSTPSRQSSVQLGTGPSITKSSNVAMEPSVPEHEPAQQRRQEELDRQQHELAEAARLAEEIARKEAERSKRQELEERARLKAEEKSKKEEARKALKAAEDARKRADQLARDEAKRLAREASESKAHALAEQKKKEKAEYEARAREKAARKAEKKAARLAQRAAESSLKADAQRMRREELSRLKEISAREKAAGKAAARQQAKASAELLAQIFAAQRTFLMSASAELLQKLGRLGRPLVFGSALMVFAALLVLPFLSLAMWARPVEQAIVAIIGEPVEAKDMRIAYWPQPHLALEGVTIGSISDIEARRIKLYPDLLSLMVVPQKISDIEIEGLTIDQQHFVRVLQWIDTSSKQREYVLSAIRLKEAVIESKVLTLPSFNADIHLTDAGNLDVAHLSANNINAEIKPHNNVLGIKVQATNWQAPFGPTLTFEDMKAIGTVTENRLALEISEGRIYGGTISGSVTLEWISDWLLNSHIVVTKLDLAELSSTQEAPTRLKGKLFATIDLKSRTASVNEIVDHAMIQARFEAEEGEFPGFDLGRAAAGKEQVGGVTRFDNITGNWTFGDDKHQLSHLKMTAGGLKAQGDVAITAEHNLIGKIQTNLQLASRQLQGRFDVTGKLTSPRLRK